MPLITTFFIHELLDEEVVIEHVVEQFRMTAAKIQFGRQFWELLIAVLED